MPKCEMLPLHFPASKLTDFSIQILPLLQMRFFLFLFILEDLLLTSMILLHSMLLHLLLAMLARLSIKNSNSVASYFSY